jgi:hypothetical protein
VRVSLHRCGEYRLKGVPELVGVVQAIPEALEGRLELFAPSTGLKVGGRAAESMASLKAGSGLSRELALATASSHC